MPVYSGLNRVEAAESPELRRYASDLPLPTSSLPKGMTTTTASTSTTAFPLLPDLHNPTDAPTTLFPLPPELPKPIDDGQAIHLIGHPIPPLIDLPCSSSTIATIDLFSLSLAKPVLLFVYPGTGELDGSFPVNHPPTNGSGRLSSWEQIPGARGCTPRLLSVKEIFPRLLKKERENTGEELKVFGLSLSDVEAGREAAERLKLPVR